jgi:hypothetical protein
VFVVDFPQIAAESVVGLESGVRAAGDSGEEGSGVGTKGWDCCSFLAQVTLAEV